MDILTVSHLTKIYGEGEAATRALDDVSFSVEEGEFVAIVGSSGSGKSTLLHLIGGVDRPTSGHVLLNGADVYARSDEELAVLRRRDVGLVYQFYNLIPVLNVVENMTLPVLMDGRAVNEERLGMLLDGLGLRGHERFLPNQLSGGQQQRVAIGRALMNAPAVVLADEPTGNLDPTTSLGIMEVLDAINRTGTTIVMATHNEEIVNSMRKRVVELHNGKIVRDEAHGSYDSALFFPDAEVEAKSDAAHHVLAAATKAIEGSDEPSEGIARLANSVHSGRTGRYGETFAPLEDTLTWGKGIPLDEQAAALESTQAFDPFNDESGETAAVADTSVSSAAEPPAPPEPPEPPAPPEPPVPPVGEQSAADQTSDDQPAEGAKE